MNKNKKNLLKSHYRIPYNPKLTKRAKELRKNMTEPEKLFWIKILKPIMDEFSDLRFLRQRPINHFIPDFYCANLKLIIEIDGDSHLEQILYDKERTEVLKTYGLKVLRYNNRDIINNIEGVFDDFLSQIKLRKQQISVQVPLNEGDLGGASLNQY